MRGLTFGLGVLLLALLAEAASAQTRAPCTYYAAPVESEGGRVPAGEPYAQRYAVGTPDAPIPVSDFWTRKLVKPGTVLCLKDGEYRGPLSMIKPPPNQFPGRSGARVVIRAVNDGHVFIDGEFEHTTLNLVGMSYWTIEGLNVFNSRNAVVGVAGLDQKGERDREPIRHVVLRRIVAWRDYLPFGAKEDYDAIGGPNVHIFSIADADDVLVEDCAGFGWARKIFQNYRSKRVTFRRSWARWDGRYPYKGGTKFGFSCSYTGYDALCENLIATVGGTRDRQAQPADYAPGVHLIAIDGVRNREPMRWLEPADRDRYDLGLVVKGSLAYAPPTSPFQLVTGFLIGGNVYPSRGVKGVLIEDSVAAVGTTGKPAAILNACDDDMEKYPEGCSWDRAADRGRAPVRMRDVTLIAAAEPPTRIKKDWILEGVVQRSFASRGDIYRSPSGGSLCHRTVEGRKTPLPLWPWPMQDRIRAATQRSNWPTADVMGEISHVFGPPPAECRSS